MSETRPAKKQESGKSLAGSLSVILFALFWIITVAVKFSEGDRGVRGESVFAFMAAGRIAALCCAAASLALTAAGLKKGRAKVTALAVCICTVIIAALFSADYVCDIFTGSREAITQEWRVRAVRDRDAYDTAAPDIVFTDERGERTVLPISYELGEMLLGGRTETETLRIVYYPATRIIQAAGPYAEESTSDNA